MKRAHGRLEQEVLAVLGTWGQSGLTPGEVRRRLDPELAYTTVMTVLSRLAEKGTLQREKVGRGYLYRPVADVDGQTAAAMRKVLDSGQDRAAVLRRFLGGLDAADEALLTEYLGDRGPDIAPGTGLA